MKSILYTFATIILTSIVLINPSDLSAQNKNIKMESITAIELYNAFRNNNNEAKNKYSMKTILISGVAVKVGPDVYGLPSVEVSEKSGVSCRALCVLPFTDYLKLRHVSKKDNVVIQGEVRGYAEEYDLVVVKQCKIISVNGKKP